MRRIKILNVRVNITKEWGQVDPRGFPLLTNAHQRCTVWLKKGCKTARRTAKNCFENKVRIWNHQGCAVAVLCPRQLAFIFGWQEKHTQPRSQHLSSYRPIDERPWERGWNISSCPAGRPPFWDFILRFHFEIKSLTRKLFAFSPLISCVVLKFAR